MLWKPQITRTIWCYVRISASSWKKINCSVYLDKFHTPGSAFPLCVWCLQVPGQPSTSPWGNWGRETGKSLAQHPLRRDLPQSWDLFWNFKGKELRSHQWWVERQFGLLNQFFPISWFSFKVNFKLLVSWTLKSLQIYFLLVAWGAGLRFVHSGKITAINDLWNSISQQKEPAHQNKPLSIPVPFSSQSICPKSQLIHQDLLAGVEN